MYLSKYFSTTANNSIVQVCPDPSSAKLKEITKRLFSSQFRVPGGWPLCATLLLWLPYFGAAGGAQPLETTVDQRIGVRGWSIHSPLLPICTPSIHTRL